jgi:hypothetical protein
MTYPQSRVFAVLSFPDDFALPQPGVFIRVNVVVDDVDIDATEIAGALGYSAFYFFHVAGGNNANLLCPTGWTSPSGFETTHVLAGNHTYGVLYDREHSAITIITTL